MEVEDLRSKGVKDPLTREDDSVYSPAAISVRSENEGLSF